jgi:hypothetical protein
MKQPLFGRLFASGTLRDSCCDDSLGQPAAEPEFAIRPRSTVRRRPLNELVDTPVVDQLGWPVGRVRRYEFDIARSRVVAVISLDAAGSPSIVIPADELRLRRSGEYVLKSFETVEREARAVPVPLG